MEFRYYILSRRLWAKRFAEAVRSRCSIENQLHWQLDVTFRENEFRIRKGHAEANFKLLRKTALSLLKNNKSAKVGIKNKCIAAALDEDYILEVPARKVIYSAIALAVPPKIYQLDRKASDAFLETHPIQFEQRHSD